MKRIIVCSTVVLCLLIGCFGCAEKFQGVQDFLTNIGGKAVSVLCGFTDQQASQAEAAAVFITGALGYGELTPAIQQAVATFRNVQARICVSDVQLQEAITVFDQAVEEPKVGIMAPPPNIDDLRMLVK